MQMANINIKAMKILPTFSQLKKLFPLTRKAEETIRKGREDVIGILTGKDKRLLVIAGPCSIHSYDEAIEIAKGLSEAAQKYSEKMVILMRVCCDKPRTKRDWCGWFSDPNLDGSHDIALGYKMGRKLMLEIAEMGLPIACELLTPNNFHVVSDVVSYAWIGARTITSPETRNAGSGLSVPVGIKNANVNDEITDALHAMDYVRHPGFFTGFNNGGRFCLISTKGNPHPNLILRGGKSGPNYKTDIVEGFVCELRKRELPDKVVVDCSHGNCEGDYKRQLEVLDYLINARVLGDENVVGVMIESYLKEGKQSKDLKLGVAGSRERVEPGLSVTDACISKSDLENALATMFQKLG